MTSRNCTEHDDINDNILIFTMMVLSIVSVREVHNISSLEYQEFYTDLHEVSYFCYNVSKNGARARFIKPPKYQNFLNFFSVYLLCDWPCIVIQCG